MGGKHGGIAIGDRGKHHPTIVSRSSDTEERNRLDRKFELYESKLDLPDKKIDLINERRNTIEDILKEELSINEKHIIGSYARGTMIESVEGNDIDIMLVIDEKKHGDWLKQQNGPSNCLQTVKRIIQNDPQFIDAEVHLDRHAVTVKYRDFNIDVVPAFRSSSGGYKIPDTRGNKSWIKTNPRMFKSIMAASDRAHNGRVSEVVKIVKGWNQTQNIPLKSFHIETMVYSYFKTKSKSEVRMLSDDVKDFFSNLPWHINTSSYEPVYGEKVDTYLSPDQRAAAIRKAQRAKNRIEKAQTYQEKGQLKLHDLEYERMFGKKFPK